MTDMTRVALVTGGNKGIGYHIVRQLTEAGIRVLLGSRNVERGQAAVDELAAEGLAVKLVQLDVTNADSVAAATKTIELAPGRLDILVNNAGVAIGFAAPSQASVDDVRATYETNVFGVVATTNAMLPLLRRSPSPRVVNVSSVLGAMHALTDPEMRWADLTPLAYRSSKAALNAVTVLYAIELRDTGIKVNAVCPGLRATGFGGGTAMPDAGDPAEGAAGAVRLALIGNDGPTGEFHNYDGTVYPW